MYKKLNWIKYKNISQYIENFQDCSIVLYPHTSISMRIGSSDLKIFNPNNCLGLAILTLTRTKLKKRVKVSFHFAI